MRITIALFVVAASVVLPAQSPDPSGSWDLRTNFEWMPAVECVFAYRDATLTGSCSVGGASYDIKDTKVADQTLSWTYDTPRSAPNGATVRDAFAGTIDTKAAAIKGSIVGSDLSNTFPDQIGTFTATKR